MYGVYLFADTDKHEQNQHPDTEPGQSESVLIVELIDPTKLISRYSAKSPRYCSPTSAPSLPPLALFRLRPATRRPTPSSSAVRRPLATARLASVQHARYTCTGEGEGGRKGGRLTRVRARGKITKRPLGDLSSTPCRSSRYHAPPPDRSISRGGDRNLFEEFNLKNGRYSIFWHRPSPLTVSFLSKDGLTSSIDDLGRQTNNLRAFPLFVPFSRLERSPRASSKKALQPAREDDIRVYIRERYRLLLKQG